MSISFPTARLAPGLLERLGRLAYWAWLGTAALLLMAACASPTSYALVGQSICHLLAGG